ncbi:hypothetical protein CHUAL_009218 [Chamberlinius hualienensis]
MDFNVKKIASEAATVFTRAVQYTEEKLGTSEKTELDAHFESQAQRCDKTRIWTEKLLNRVEGVITPNPGNRVEDFLFEKLDRKPRDRLSNLDWLGVDMIDAGDDFGAGTAYGSALIKVGRTQQRLGMAEREFIQKSAKNFMQPLRSFLDGDMKTILKERKILENKRLDLDACKSRLRKARSMEGQQNAERDLRITQSEFDRQAEITKLLLEGISSAHVNHLRCLNDFVESQITFYSQCHQCMLDLQKELSNSTATGSAASYPKLFTTPATPQTSMGDISGSAVNGKRARVLYDYDASDSNELSLLADEVITVYNSPGLDEDWLVGERGSQKGKVPAAYLEIIS